MFFCPGFPPVSWCCYRFWRATWRWRCSWRILSYFELSYIGVITFLKEVEILVHTKILHFERGDEIRNQRKYEDVNDKLKRAVEQYSADNKISFLRSVAYNLHSFWALFSIFFIIFLFAKYPFCFIIWWWNMIYFEFSEFDE